MTKFASAFGILFCLHFVSFLCQGKITLPPGGDTFVVAPGTARMGIEWTFDDAITVGTTRRWRFVTKRKPLALIVGTGSVTKLSSGLPEFEIVEPATLVLKNIDDRYNGIYEFSFDDGVNPDSSRVSVFIAAKPTTKINCSTPTTVNEGDDVKCLCKGEGGNPPANVTWYKDGVKIGVAGDEGKMLTLSNIDKTASGTYKCVTQSYTLKDEESIEIFVYYPIPPAVISFTSTPEKSILGQSVVMTCEAIAVPVPSYTIIHNDTEVVSTKTTYIINVVKFSDTGSYKCVAKNKLGNSSKNYCLSVVATRTTNAPKTKILATEKATCNKSNDGTKWYMIVVVLASDFIIGMIFSYIFVHFRRQCRNRKPQSNSEPETSKVDSIYHDLDLSKMNSEDNYQSLTVNFGRNEADYENQNESTYTELNKVRDVENNYQSLT